MACPAQFFLVFTLVDLLQMLFQVASFLCGPPSYIQVHNPTGNISHKHPPDFDELQSNTWP